MKTVQLSEIAETGSGGTPKRSVQEYFGPGVPWLSIADLNDGVVNGAKESLTDAGIANSAAKVVPPGTLFVAMYGSIGKLGIAGTEVCTSQAIAFIRPDETAVDRKYLFHYLLAQRPQLQALGRGGTQMNISQGDLKKWPVPLPPLSEQRRIAAILDHADALRAKRRQVITHLDHLAQAIFHDMFDDGESSTTTKRVLLNTLTQRITYGFTNPMTHVDVGIPIVTAKSIKDRSIDLTSGNFTTEEDFVALSSKSRPQRYDILITKDGTIGRCAVVGDEPPFCINQSVALVRPKCDLVRPEYLVGYLSTCRVQSQMNGMSKGNALKHLQITELAEFSVPFPSLQRQDIYAQRMKLIRRQRLLQMAATSQEDELLGSLQSRLFGTPR